MSKLLSFNYSYLENILLILLKDFNNLVKLD